MNTIHTRLIKVLKSNQSNHGLKIKASSVLGKVCSLMSLTLEYVSIAGVQYNVWLEDRVMIDCHTSQRYNSHVERWSHFYLKLEWSTVKLWELMLTVCSNLCRIYGDFLWTIYNTIMLNVRLLSKTGCSGCLVYNRSQRKKEKELIKLRARGKHKLVCCRSWCCCFRRHNYK